MKDQTGGFAHGILPPLYAPATGDVCPNCGGDLNWKGAAGIDLPVGTSLGNGLRTYWVGAAKGKGGFGITYAALEQNSKKRMAVKEYFPIHCAYRSGDGVRVAVRAGMDAAFQTGMENFLKEARMLLAQEDLSTVVKVIDFFQTNNTAYLVMEYLDGIPLFKKMTQEGAAVGQDPPAQAAAPSQGPGHPPQPGGSPSGHQPGQYPLDARRFLEAAGLWLRPVHPGREEHDHHAQVGFFAH